MIKVNIKTEGVNLNTDGHPYESRWTSTEALMDDSMELMDVYRGTNRRPYKN